MREFLTSRRARVTPDQAGLLAYGGNRRVPGLRREFHHTGVNHIHHPLVGDPTLAFESLQVSADAGQTLLVYPALITAQENP